MDKLDKSIKEFREDVNRNKGNRVTPEDIQNLKGGEVFVFGSNELGLHGSGAARIARQWGAGLGQGFGMMAQTFAIPTKDWEIEQLPLEVIKFYVDRFIAFADRPMSKRWKFYVTKIGCGLAGYTPKDIAPMFEQAMNIKTVYLPQEFIDIINSLELKY